MKTSNDLGFQWSIHCHSRHVTGLTLTNVSMLQMLLSAPSIKCKLKNYCSFHWTSKNIENRHWTFLILTRAPYSIVWGVYCKFVRSSYFSSSSNKTVGVNTWSLTSDVDKQWKQSKIIEEGNMHNSQRINLLKRQKQIRSTCINIHHARLSMRLTLNMLWVWSKLLPAIKSITAYKQAATTGSWIMHQINKMIIKYNIMCCSQASNTSRRCSQKLL